MARSWLEVTTDEVQSKRGADQRLAERRAAMAERARTVVQETVAPLFERAAAQGDWHYRQDQDTEWSVIRCGLYGPGDVERDPTVAFYVVEFDAYQPLVVLRRKARGAAAQAHAQIVGVDALDRTAIEAFLEDA